MHTALLVAVVVMAEPSDAQVELLNKFRAEFISIKPGVGRFPTAMTMGRSECHALEQRRWKLSRTQEDGPLSAICCIHSAPRFLTSSAVNTSVWVEIPH